MELLEIHWIIGSFNVFRYLEPLQIVVETLETYVELAILCRLMTTSFIVEQAPKSSILALSSDSESCQNSSLLREEKAFQFPEKEMDEDAALTGREEKTSVKKVSKEKSPKKGLKSPKKEKDVVNNVKRKGMKSMRW